MEWQQQKYCASNVILSICAKKKQNRFPQKYLRQKPQWLSDYHNCKEYVLLKLITAIDEYFCPKRQNKLFNNKNNNKRVFVLVLIHKKYGQKRRKFAGVLFYVIKMVDF